MHLFRVQRALTAAGERFATLGACIWLGARGPRQMVLQQQIGHKPFAAERAAERLLRGMAVTYVLVQRVPGVERLVALRALERAIRCMHRHVLRQTLRLLCFVIAFGTGKWPFARVHTNVLLQRRRAGKSLAALVAQTLSMLASVRVRQSHMHAQAQLVLQRSIANAAVHRALTVRVVHVLHDVVFVGETLRAHFTSERSLGTVLDYIVAVQNGGRIEVLLAFAADVRLDAIVAIVHVFAQRLLVLERLLTQTARVPVGGLVAFARSYVLLLVIAEAARQREARIAQLALVRLLARMDAPMSGEIVSVAEALLAIRTREWLSDVLVHPRVHLIGFAVGECALTMRTMKHGRYWFIEVLHPVNIRIIDDGALGRRGRC